MTVAIALLTALCAVLGIPSAVLAAQVLASIRGARRGGTARDPNPTEDQRRMRPSIAVLVPAHNEAAGITETLVRIQRQLEPGDRLLVVADNCTDETAKIAAVTGADVISRDEPARRGKGYALDHGVRHLGHTPPDILILVDADCLLEPHCLDHLARCCAQTQGPVQALYLMAIPTKRTLAQRIATFAWRVKNQIRPTGAAALGAPCQLMGTGMAFPWSLISEARLATSHLTEDMKLGVDLALAGRAPTFCPQAVVVSGFPESTHALSRQHARWSQGHWQVILQDGVRLLTGALAQRRLALAWMALDLCVPPLASLVALQVLATLATLAWGWRTHHWLPFLCAASGTALLSMSVLLAWHHRGRDLLSSTDLLQIPRYVLSKLFMYAALAKGQRATWERTERDGEGKPGDGPSG